MGTFTEHPEWAGPSEPSPLKSCTPQERILLDKIRSGKIITLRKPPMRCIKCGEKSCYPRFDHPAAFGLTCEWTCAKCGDKSYS